MEMTVLSLIRGTRLGWRIRVESKKFINLLSERYNLVVVLPSGRFWPVTCIGGHHDI